MQPYHAHTITWTVQSHISHVAWLQNAILPAYYGLSLVEMHRGCDNVVHKIMDLIHHFQFWQMISMERAQILKESIQSGYTIKPVDRLVGIWHMRVCYIMIHGYWILWCMDASCESWGSEFAVHSAHDVIITLEGGANTVRTQCCFGWQSSIFFPEFFNVNVVYWTLSS